MDNVNIEKIESVISEELDRQARSDARRIDIHAMASRIGDVLNDEAPAPRTQMREAKRPNELNASNDG